MPNVEPHQNFELPPELAGLADELADQGLLDGDFEPRQGPSAYESVYEPPTDSREYDQPVEVEGSSPSKLRRVATAAGGAVAGVALVLFLSNLRNNPEAGLPLYIPDTTESIADNPLDETPLNSFPPRHKSTPMPTPTTLPVPMKPDFDTNRVSPTPAPPVIAPTPTVIPPSGVRPPVTIPVPQPTAELPTVDAESRTYNPMPTPPLLATPEITPPPYTPTPVPTHEPPRPREEKPIPDFNGPTNEDYLGSPSIPRSDEGSGPRPEYNGGNGSGHNNHPGEISGPGSIGSKV